MLLIVSVAWAWATALALFGVLVLHATKKMVWYAHLGLTAWLLGAVMFDNQYTLWGMLLLLVGLLLLVRARMMAFGPSRSSWAKRAS